MSDSEFKNISLLYEFDSRSPLFARIAYERMKEGNLKDAEEILTNGLEFFPHYPTPYFLLSEVKTRLDKTEEAETLLQKGNILLGDKKTFEFYSEKIAGLKSKLKDFETPRSTELSSAEAEETEIAENKNEQETPIEERLDELAQQLENAQIPESVKEETQINEEGGIISGEDTSPPNLEIVSETLGMILESQNKFKEALDVYQKLIELEPDKKEFYETKIQELSERISEENE